MAIHVFAKKRKNIYSNLFKEFMNGRRFISFIDIFIKFVCQSIIFLLKIIIWINE